MDINFKIKSYPTASLEEEIAGLLKAKFFHPALVIALTLPDICCALESGTGKSSGPAYKAWCSAFLKDRYPELTGDDIWNLRCGVVHEGKFGHKKMQFHRIIWSIGSAQGFTLHRNRMTNIGGLSENVLQLDAEIFCNDLISGSHDWYDTLVDNEMVNARSGSLIRLHPDGYAPYVVGVPIIA